MTYAQPSISVITVFNRPDILREHLVASLRQQDIEYEWIAIDNCNHTFASAAAALNQGVACSHGQILMFAHQDMRLLTTSTLRRLATLIQQTPLLGAAGVAGVTERGEPHGWMIDSYRLWGRWSDDVQAVQTLDECLLATTRPVFEQVQFDATVFNGWHCYAADYCLAVQKLGLVPYVLPLATQHATLAGNTHLLCEYQAKLWQKHASVYSQLYTTCGPVNPQALMRRWWHTQVDQHRPKPQNLLAAVLNPTEIQSVVVVIHDCRFPIQQAVMDGVNVTFTPFDQLNGDFDAMIHSQLHPDQPHVWLPLASEGRKILGLHFSLAGISQAVLNRTGQELISRGWRVYAHSPQEIVFIR